MRGAGVLSIATERVTAADVRRLVEKKERLKHEVAGSLTTEERRKAERDWHAKRSPIPCGMTIHTGIGCSYGCAYCYIYDMGFTMKPQPYPLTGKQLVYALLVNPYFVPGPRGTLLAFGSVTEPFMPETAVRALEYLKWTRDVLGNPQQLSTKTALKGKLLEEFLEIVDPRIDVLVTITTIKHWRRLEPGASPPEERFEFMRRLAEAGIGVTLFLRPIIPGVTDVEAEEIIRRSAEAGVKRIVPGTLRVSHGILKRLSATRLVALSAIESRLPRRPRGPRDQVPIRGRDLKERVIELAKIYGLQVLPASCGANIVSHGLSCYACRMGPCGDPTRLPEADEEAIWEIMRIAGIPAVSVEIRGQMVVYYHRGAPKDRLRVADQWIIAVLKRIPIARPAARLRGA